MPLSDEPWIVPPEPGVPVPLTVKPAVVPVLVRTMPFVAPLDDIQRGLELRRRDLAHPQQFADESLLLLVHALDDVVVRLVVHLHGLSEPTGNVIFGTFVRWSSEYFLSSIILD